jgi:hypothetical protein
MNEIWMNLPESISQIIIHGFLNKNQLDFLLKKPIEILQIAVIMEKSSRRKTGNIIKYNKPELVSYILNKTYGLKFIRSYIEKAEKNLLIINKLEIDDIISLNNGLTHRYYMLKSMKENEYNCIELKNFPLKYSQVEYVGIRILSYEELVIKKSNMETAILLQTHSSKNIQIHAW